MKLLLDTHIWLWALTSPKRLEPRIRRELSSAKNEIFLSPISIWEASHVFASKRITVRESFESWVDQALNQTPIHEAPFNLAVAREASRIHLPQGDPGDVFLAATAVVFRLKFVTADEQLLRCSWLDTLSA